MWLTFYASKHFLAENLIKLDIVCLSTQVGVILTFFLLFDITVMVGE